jgi:periplasmic divalent cation tolerance protein
MPMAMIYFTAANREDVLSIGRALVEDRLAACINVLGEITSIYPWEGAIQQENEVAAIAKTSTENVQRVIDRVKELHPYTCPCVVSWPITQGNADYLQWLGDVLEM